MLSTFTSQPPQLLSAAQLVDEMAAGSIGSGVTSFSTAASHNTTAAAATSSPTAAVSLDSSCDPASQLGKSDKLKIDYPFFPHFRSCTTDNLTIEKAIFSYSGQREKRYNVQTIYIFKILIFQILIF